MVETSTSLPLYTIELNCYLILIADEEFEELCFDFGLELDEVVSLCLKALLLSI